MILAAIERLNDDGSADLQAFVVDGNGCLATRGMSRVQRGQGIGQWIMAPWQAPEDSPAEPGPEPTEVEPDVIDLDLDLAFKEWEPEAPTPKPAPTKAPPPAPPPRKIATAPAACWGPLVIISG